MKKILSLLLLLLICAGLFACKKGGSTGTGKLTEKVYFDYTAEGFALVKNTVDKKGNVHGEQIYMIDSSLGVLCLYAEAENTLDKNGRLTGATARYTQNAIHALPEKTVTISESTNALYGYEVKDASGNIFMYLCEEHDASGRSVKTEYYTAGGRLYMTEEVEYHENGERKALCVKDSIGETLYTVSYNTRGNFTSAEISEGKTTVKVSTEYYASGVIKSYTATSTDNAGGYTSAPETVTFNENGDVTKHGEFTIFYSAEGKPERSVLGKTEYLFDENGFVTKKEDNTNAVAPITTEYTYDESGRLTCKTAKKKNSVSSKTVYTYAEDGTYTAELSGSDSKKTQLTFYDARGNVVKQEFYRSSGALYAHVTQSYDAYGRLTKVVAYNGPNSTGKAEFTYNVHGDVIEEKTTGSYGAAHRKYEYYESGKLKKISVLNSMGNVEQSIFYFEDGSYRIQSGKEMLTYDKYDRIIKRESVHGVSPAQKKLYEYYTGEKLRSYFYYSGGKLVESEEYREDGKPTKIVKTDADGKQTSTVCEYYENGNEKSVTVHVDGALTSSIKYNEKANVTEMMVTDENGKKVISVYTRENEVPSRIDTYTDGVLTEYTLLEFFTYTNDNVNNPKSVRTYDKSGTLLLNMEYEKIKVQKSPGYVYALVKQEIFENGVLIASSVMEYSEKNGVMSYKEETVGNICTKTEYNTNNISDKQEIFRRRTYVDGKLASLYEYTGAYKNPQYKETFYDENGQATHAYIYKTGEEDADIIGIHTYEYHTSGYIFREYFYNVKNGENQISYINEYDETGYIARCESFTYSSGGSVSQKDVIVYGKNGAILQTMVYKSLSTELYLDSEVCYEYHANGNISKKTEISYYTDGTVDKTTVTEYDEQGRLLRSYYNGGESDTSETLCAYGEDGERIKYEIYKNGKLIHRELTEHDENGNIVHTEEWKNGAVFESFMSYTPENLIKERKNHVNGTESLREVYEYNEDGGLASLLTYESGVLTSESLYNAYGLITEKTTYKNGSLYERDVYEYHKNKQLSAHLKYRGETLVSEDYYDTDGNKISTI